MHIHNFCEVHRMAFKLRKMCCIRCVYIYKSNIISNESMPIAIVIMRYINHPFIIILDVSQLTSWACAQKEY